MYQLTSCKLLYLPYVAVGSRKRPRSSQDEGAPDLKQQPEALSDLSNFVEDIGPAPEVLKRHYASSRKSSSQINQVIYVHYVCICTIL